MENRLMDALLDRHLRVVAALLAQDCASRRPIGLEVLDQARQGVGTSIEDEIVAELANRSVDLEIRNDLFGMDERAVETGFDAVVEENRVERDRKSGGEGKRVEL